MVSRSAGGILVLHLAKLGLVENLSGVLSIEPVRLQETNTRLGQLKFIKYQLFTEGKFEADNVKNNTSLAQSAQISKPGLNSGMLQAVKRQIAEVRHYQHLWASSHTFDNCMEISKKGNMISSVIFAQESMATDRGRLEEYVDKVASVAGQATGGEVLNIDIIPDTTHGSFDNPKLYLETYRKFKTITC